VKQNMSPTTNTLVSQRCLMIEWSSPSVKRIAKITYICIFADLTESIKEIRLYFFTLATSFCKTLLQLYIQVLFRVIRWGQQPILESNWPCLHITALSQSCDSFIYLAEDVPHGIPE
jgi:hypothetical protein